MGSMNKHSGFLSEMIYCIGDMLDTIIQQINYKTMIHYLNTVSSETNL